MSRPEGALHSGRIESRSMREMFKSGETMHLHPASEEETEKEDGHTGGRVGEGDAGDETGVAAEGSG